MDSLSVSGDEPGGTARVIEDTHVGVRGGACRIRRQRDTRERNRVVRQAKRHVAVRMEAREGEGVDRERPVAVEGEATREVLDDRRLEELAALSGVRGAVLAACECAAAACLGALPSRLLTQLGVGRVAATRECGRGTN